MGGRLVESMVKGFREDRGRGELPDRGPIGDKVLKVHSFSVRAKYDLTTLDRTTNPRSAENDAIFKRGRRRSRHFDLSLLPKDQELFRVPHFATPSVARPRSGSSA